MRLYTRPYQKTGTGKLKLDRNMYGTGRSVHRPFNYRSISVRRPFFFKRAHIVRIEWGNFFLTPTIYHNPRNSVRIILCDLKKIAYLHIVCDFNFSDDSQG